MLVLALGIGRLAAQTEQRAGETTDTWVKRLQGRADRIDGELKKAEAGFESGQQYAAAGDIEETGLKALTDANIPALIGKAVDNELLKKTGNIVEIEKHLDEINAAQKKGEKISDIDGAIHLAEGYKQSQQFILPAAGKVTEVSGIANGARITG